MTKRKELVFNAFSNRDPVKKANDRSNETEFGSFDNDMCKRVLDLLETS